MLDPTPIPCANCHTSHPLGTQYCAPVSMSAEREREEVVARAIHDTATGCPELWAGTNQEPWRAHARDVLAAMPPLPAPSPIPHPAPPCLRCDALAEDNRQLRETRAYWSSDLKPEADQHYQVLTGFQPDEQEAHHQFARALNALHTIALSRATREEPGRRDGEP